MPLFFTISWQFDFHINLKPCHPSFISDVSPKAQLLFCHFCCVFACLCNALIMFPMKHIKNSHLLMQTQQENLSHLLVAWSNSTTVSLLPCLCKKSELKRNKILPSYFLKVFSKLVHSRSKVFILFVATLPLTRDCAATCSNLLFPQVTVTCVTLNQSLLLHNSCIYKSLPTHPDKGDYTIPAMSYFGLHCFFW